MKHLVLKDNTLYAALTVPAEVRHLLGKARFFQSTKTNNPTEAKNRAAVLVAGWKAEISKARGKLPNPKDDFWVSLRKEYMTTDDEGAKFVIEELAEKEALKSSDPEASVELYKFATNQAGTLLAPLVEDWKSAQKGGRKTIDQKHRDLVRMADHFLGLDALKPQRIKAWTAKLLGEGSTYSSFVRIGGACRSFWAYLQDSSTIPMETPDPFFGSFKLALKAAVRTDTGRSGNAFTAEELTKIYAAALKVKDKSLADLIALGAYTGARVEELGRLTKETCKDGMFTIEKSKTNAGVRQVPIHPAVAPLVARLLAVSEDGYLLPSTSENQYDLRMAALGQKFTRLKTGLGFGKDHVFHNTRSTLITLMDQAGVPEGVSADVVGHDKKTMTYGLYSSGSSMAQKLEAISKVSYPGALGTP
jgi:integrase